MIHWSQHEFNAHKHWWESFSITFFSTFCLLNLFCYITLFRLKLLCIFWNKKTAGSQVSNVLLDLKNMHSDEWATALSWCITHVWLAHISKCFYWICSQSFSKCHNKIAHHLVMWNKCFIVNALDVKKINQHWLHVGINAHSLSELSDFHWDDYYLLCIISIN